MCRSVAYIYVICTRASVRGKVIAPAVCGLATSFPILLLFSFLQTRSAASFAMYIHYSSRMSMLYFPNANYTRYFRLEIYIYAHFLLLGNPVFFFLQLVNYSVSRFVLNKLVLHPAGQLAPPTLTLLLHITFSTGSKPRS